MTKHRPSVQLSSEQELHRTELSSKKILGDSFLQQRLAHQYGIKNIPKVDMPIECQTYLSEVPVLMQEKLKQDDKAWMARKDNRDPCSNALINQKAFETLNRSTQ